MKSKIRRLGALIIALALMLASMTGALAAIPDEAKDARNGVVRILTVFYYADGSSAMYTGTGFCIGDEGKPVEYILTNSHLISELYTDGTYSEANEIHVLFEDFDDPSTTTATIIKNFAFNPDLAVLRMAAPTTKRQPLALISAEASLDVGDDVFSLGFPSAADDATNAPAKLEDVTMTQGIVSKMNYVDESNSRFIQMTASINGGNSGGPLVNDNGQVVGINTMKNTNADDMYFALNIDYAMEYLDNMGIPYIHGSTETAAVAAPVESSGPEATDEGGDEAGDGDTQAEDEEGTELEWWMIAIPAAVLVAGAAVAVTVSKRKKEQPEPELRSTPVSAGASANIPAYTPPAQPRPQAQPQNAGRQLTSIGTANSLGGRSYFISGTMTVGRDPARCQIVFPAKTAGVSGVHCQVQNTPEGIVLTDVGSSYGTFLENGTKLNANTPYSLRVGETFYLASRDNGFRVK